MSVVDLKELHKGLDVVRRLKTRAHINRGFARSAELGTLEADEPKSVDFYLGRSDAFEEAARLVQEAGQ